MPVERAAVGGLRDMSTSAASDSESPSSQVDWGQVAEIVESYHKASCAASTAQTVETSESEWFNPFSWSMPTTRNVEVNWEACATVAAENTEKDVARYQDHFDKNAPDIIAEIQQREYAIAHERNRLISKLRETQSYNSSMIEKSIQNYDDQIAIAKFVRDGSASTILLSSTFVTGGTSLALLGSASVLTGYGKYQDTGSMSAGIVAGGGTALIGWFGIAGKAAKMSNGGKAAVILAKGVVETGSGLAAGDSLDKAMISGASTLVAEGAATKLFGTKAVKGIFKNMPMPVKITATGGIRARNFMTKSLGREFVSGASKWTAKTATKKGIVAATKASDSQTARYGALAGATPIPSQSRTADAFSAVKGVR